MRIKTDDQKLEAAYQFADAADAARRLSPGPMPLGEIIDALDGIADDTFVQFDFGGFEPTGIDSYRGYYSDLALGFDREGMKVGALRAELQDADGGTFEGYKGGEYRMDRSTPVWVANYGRSHGVAVVAVETREKWRVILRTALID